MLIENWKESVWNVSGACILVKHKGWIRRKGQTLEKIVTRWTQSTKPKAKSHIKCIISSTIKQVNASKWIIERLWFRIKQNKSYEWLFVRWSLIYFPPLEIQVSPHNTRIQAIVPPFDFVLILLSILSVCYLRYNIEVYFFLIISNAQHQYYLQKPSHCSIFTMCILFCRRRKFSCNQWWFLNYQNFLSNLRTLFLIVGTLLFRTV